MKRYGWFGLAFVWASHAHAADFREPGVDVPSVQAVVNEPSKSGGRSGKASAANTGVDLNQDSPPSVAPPELADHIQRILRGTQAKLREQHLQNGQDMPPSAYPPDLRDHVQRILRGNQTGLQEQHLQSGQDTAPSASPPELPDHIARILRGIQAGLREQHLQGDRDSASQRLRPAINTSVPNDESLLPPETTTSPSRAADDALAARSAEVIVPQETRPAVVSPAVAGFQETSPIPAVTQDTPAVQVPVVVALPDVPLAPIAAAASDVPETRFVPGQAIDGTGVASGQDSAFRDYRPGFTEYVLRYQSSLQRQSNPFRVSDDLRGTLPADNVFVNEVSGAVIVPILSDRTRLVASGNLGNARYQKNRQLDYQPKRLDAAFQWRAGDLWQGQVGVRGEDSLNRFLATSAPDRDIVKTRAAFADLGLRVTDSLTLPLLSFQQSSLRYQYPINAMTYNRDEKRVQASVRYSGMAASYVQAGITESRMEYLDRTAAQVATIDNRYADREGFVEGQWEYSAKTLLKARLGYLQRSYANLSARNVSLVTAETRAAWQYSVKTRFDLDLWHRPYGNEEDPAILYSTLTGVRASIRWQATEKVWLSFNVVRENQKNTRLTAAAEGRSKALRFGPRLEWAVNPNVKIVLDGWRDNVEGINYPSSNGTVVRLGIVLSTDNRGTHEPERLLRNADCASPRYVETTTCYD